MGKTIFMNSYVSMLKFLVIFYLSNIMIFSNENTSEVPDQKKDIKNTSQQQLNLKEEVIIIDEPTGYSKEKEQKKIQEQEKILKNTSIMEGYALNRKIDQYNFAEHLVLSLIFGLGSGAAFGVLSSLYDFDLKDVNGSLPSLYLVGGIFAFAGLASSLTLTLIEHYKGFNQFSLGWQLFKYSWYSVLISSFFGTIIGAAVYGVNDNLNSLLEFTGYGAMVGSVLGIILFATLGDFKKSEDISFDLGIGAEGGIFVATKHF